MIPEWMDLVVWGNEHECQPNLVESLVGTFRIFQPGSSIATSLSEGESMSNPKHMGMVEVKGRFFRMQPIAYTQIRPFIYSDIALSSIPDLDVNDPKIEEKIKSVLCARVRHLIEEARKESDAVAVAGANFDFHVDKPENVLVRLRVDHNGYPTINQQRFGTAFLDVIANPSTVLLFAKKKKENYSGVVDANLIADAAFQNVIGDDDGLDDPMSRIKIEDLVKESLEGNHRQLNVLIEADMAQAIDDFVMKKHLSAITDIVQETLEKTQEALYKNVNAVGKDLIAEHTMKIRNREEKERARIHKEAKGKSSAELSIFSRKQTGDDSDHSSGEASVPARNASSGRAGRGSGRGTAATGRGRGRGRGEAKPTAPKGKKKKDEPDEEMSLEEEIDDDSEEHQSMTGKRGRNGMKLPVAAPKSRGKAREVSAKASKPASSSATRTSSRVAAGSKRKYVEESGDEIDEILGGMDSDESDGYVNGDDIEDSYQEEKPSRGSKAKMTKSSKSSTARSRNSPTIRSPDVAPSRSARGRAAASTLSSSVNDTVDLTEDW